MRPSVLYPGDTLCYKGTDLLAKLLSWGEWSDGHEDTAYTHVALVFDGTRLIRQNPGGPAFEDLDAQPWDQIDVYRLKEPYFYEPTDVIWLSALEAARQAHWNESYGYAEFGNLVFSDLEARIGLMQDADARRKAANWALSNHASYCSVFADQEVLQDAVRLRGSWGDDFQMFPNLGPGQARPADIPLSPLLYLVTAAPSPTPRP